MQILIPRNWSAVTLKQFSLIHRIKCMNLDPVEQITEVLMALTELTRAQVDSIDIKHLKELTRAIGFIFQDLIPDYKPKNMIEVNGQKYYANLDISKMTAGQYIDLKDFTSDPNEIISNIHNIMAVFYMPKGKKYNQVPQREVADLFYQHLTVDRAYSTAVFFYRLYTDLNPLIKDYSLQSAKKTMKKMSQEMKTSTRIGAGL